MTDRELAALWHAASEDGFPFGHLVKMLILTAQRRGEVLDATCDEFDLNSKFWTVPSHRAKNGRANVVPMSGPVVAITRDLFSLAGIDPENAHSMNELLFASKVTTTNSVSGLSRSWRRIRSRVDVILGYEAAHFTMHDIRRTVATGLQRLGIPLVVSEAVLNHQSGSAKAGVAGVYHRHSFSNEKREALAMWGKEVLEIAARYPAAAHQSD